MSFKETGRELWAGMIYMVRKSRGHEVDTQARREAALENIFGRSRFAINREAIASDSKAAVSEKNLDVNVEVEEEVRIKERVWVEMNKDYLEAIAGA